MKLFVIVLLLGLLEGAENFETSPENREMVSLAIVFDTTGSMYDDLTQLIKAAAKILNEIELKRKRLIYNYILVPIRDPGKEEKKEICVCCS